MFYENAAVTATREQTSTSTYLSLIFVFEIEEDAVSKVPAFTENPSLVNKLAKSPRGWGFFSCLAD